MNNCIFENNLLAGLYIADAQVAVSDSLIHDGGTGIWLTEINADVSLVNCLIEGNTATNRPGGLYVNNGDLSLDGCIVRDNTAYSSQWGNV